MRCVEYGLRNPLKAVKPHLIQHQRQNNGNRETPQQAEKTEQDRVSDHTPEGRRAEESQEPLESNPFTSCKTPAGLVIPEGNLNAVHRYVFIHNGQYYRNRQHGI